MPVKGTYLAIAGGGIVLLWSGLAGKKWSDVLRSVIAGKQPSATTTAYQISGTPVSAFANGSGSGSGLAANMESYVGKTPYKWGGANPSGWDCSGAFNYCANHNEGIPIPGYAGGTFTGATHGPNTLVYQVWLRTNRNWHRVSRQQVTTNDVCLWQTHMGVAVDNTDYVSAYDTQKGTVVQSINNGGPSFEIPSFWRLG